MQDAAFLIYTYTLYAYVYIIYTYVYRIQIHLYVHKKKKTSREARDALSETVVSLRTVVKFVTWLISSTQMSWQTSHCKLRRYGVASVSRIDKIIGRFCKRALQKRRYSGKVTYNLIDPTDCSHPIPVYIPIINMYVSNQSRGVTAYIYVRIYIHTYIHTYTYIHHPSTT